jgi:hypothetical protein
MVLRFMKWMTVLVALCGSSYVWAATGPVVSWADEIRERRDSVSLMDVASGASLMLSPDSLLNGWLELGDDDWWINVIKVSGSPDSADALDLSAREIASITQIASGTVQLSSWVSFSEGSTVSIHLLPLSSEDTAPPLPGREELMIGAPIAISLDSSAVVPLPAAGWLFLSALGSFLLGVKRRRSC